jgi:hypothetical protein
MDVMAIDRTLTLRLGADAGSGCGGTKGDRGWFVQRLAW